MSEMASGTSRLLRMAWRRHCQQVCRDMARSTGSDPNLQDSRAAVDIVQHLMFLAPAWDKRSMAQHTAQLAAAASEPGTTVTV